ncbi:hypothetical protein TTHERM_00845850 (macronuclear) [Tetrahymena thermophila SB210]|uniref:Uncharacterized protein n=1 Tax=Tetrahymena thermophila (strain SB210) TaxID=312017 RepID=Q22UU6_TETTS|nr:hypothetical protein TTHERM_00845850 [Tetrahymena thermophila SB210]EAR89030.1 hypothetical protein TTHERM_00845850 [Tetrahymena thermophila SB210]|eukprot:XP_001009275.1 hypothetical protein TTHERM_00845850 [Tetrahymena thermophila SB210]
MDNEKESSIVTNVRQIQYFKVISSINNNIKNAKLNDDEDKIKVKQCSFKNISQVMIEKSDCEYLIFKKLYSQKSNLQENIDQGQVEDSDRLEYMQKLKDSPIERNNIFKNIIQSFLKFIDSQQNKNLLLIHLDKSSKQEGLESSIKVIKRKLKKQKCQWNQKILSLLKSSKHQKIFQYYLENIQNLWLQHSKVENKENTFWYSKLLLRAIQDPILREEIKYYKKN